MEVRRLGTSDIMVTPMAFGAWAIGGWMWGGAEEKEALIAVKAAYEAGITTIDTAPAYGFGRSEELISKALEGIPRSNYQLLTKFGLNWSTAQGEYYFDSVDNDGKAFKMFKWASKERVMKECEDCLGRLKTDYIDLFQIHWPDSTTPVNETFEAVQRLIEQGKVRAAGVCNYNTMLVSEALDTIQLASNQVPYSLVFRDMEKEVIPQAIEKALGIISYSPLQRGLLTGKIKPGHHFSEGDTREGNRFYTDENIIKVNLLLESLKPIAEKYKATIGQLVINWTMHRPGIACVLVGARNAAQVNDNAKAFHFSLSKEDADTITALADQYTTPSLKPA
ncbi:MAG: aldo/keto reductase [Chitinophagaceae bacterium]|nr:aldo/keto reductase [Chitinophagaceae bacterium]